MGLYNTLTCKVEGCDRPFRALGFCNSHYTDSRGDRTTEQCSKENCNKGVYAKELCRQHYNYKTRKYQKKQRKCIVVECNIKTTAIYCWPHMERLKHNLPLDLNIDCRKGFRNIRWNDGVSQYPNHSLLKKNRENKLKKVVLCEICKINKAKETHHKDYRKNNHSVNNLLGLCSKCHGKLHSKYKRLYGFYLKELISFFNVSQGTISNWHKKQLLHSKVSKLSILTKR